VPAVATATLEVVWAVPGDACFCGIAGTWPGRNLLKKSILITVFPAGLRAYCLRIGRRATGRLRAAAIALRVLRASNLHSTMDLGAFANGNPQSGDIAADFSGRPDFHTVAAPQRTRHFSADDNLARIDVRRNLAVRSDGDSAVGKMNRALHLAINV